MSGEAIAAISIFGGMWVIGAGMYIYAYIKTKTKPGQLSSKELFERAYGLKDNDETNSNSDNPSP
jgi:hypothetical protein